MKKKILADYKKKLKEIQKYNKYYFDKSNPLINDAKYDKLSFNIRK